MDSPELVAHNEMRPGKIYFLDFGGNTQLLGRYSHSDTTNHHFTETIHYWNGSETFRQDDYCVHHTVSYIRRASKPEKMHLISFLIEKDIL